MSSATRLDDPTLERITRAIVERCAPRRIVLYGSRARGDADDESDYDVMVEMDALPEGDLELELIKVLFSEDVDIFVTTAEEYRAQRDDVGLLPYLIEREGKTIFARDGMTDALPPAPSRVREPRPDGTPGSVDMWVRRAESDFRSVLLEAKHGGDASTICFLAHQSGEKYIKAVIISLHRVPPRTHRFGTLLDLCPDALNTRAVRDACAVLLSGFRLSRYPPSREPTDAEARRSALAAEVVRRAARLLIEQLRTELRGQGPAD